MKGMNTFSLKDGWLEKSTNKYFKKNHYFLLGIDSNCAARHKLTTV